jgi:hypothetical protein
MTVKRLAIFLSIFIAIAASASAIKPGDLRWSQEIPPFLGEPAHPFEFFRDAQLASDAGGDTIAVWRRYDGTEFKVTVNVWNAANRRWGTQGNLTIVGGVFGPQVAFRGGQGLVIWTQEIGGFRDVRIARYTKANGWTSPVAPVVATDSAFDTAIAIDGAGNAFAVWTRVIGSDTRVQAMRYDTATSQWTNLTTLSAAGQSAFHPRIGADGTGNAHVIWDRFNGTQHALETARYDAASRTWSTFTNLGGIYPDSNGDLAVAASGDAIAVWDNAVSSSVPSDYFSAHYDWRTRTWGSATKIGTGKGKAFVGINQSGDAVAVWPVPSGDLNAARFNPLTGVWSSPLTISEAIPSGISEQPAVVVDPAGVATIAFSQNRSTYHVIYAWRYSQTGTERSGLGLGIEPRLAVDGAGNVMVVWMTAACSFGADVCPPINNLQSTQWLADPRRRRAAR